MGPDNAADAILPRPAPRSGGKRRADADADGDSDGDAGAGGAGGGGAAGPMEGIEGAAASELTLGERLRQLELTAGGSFAGAADGARRKERSAADPFGGKVPAADSLAVLLSQALSSRDNGLLERVLSVGDDRVLARTVQRLRPEDAVQFLGVAVGKLNLRPQRGTQLSRWIRAVLLGHASHLMSAPSARPILSSLYQTIEARLALHRPMLALAGRLDLLLAQQLSVDEGGVADEDAEERKGRRGPLVEYVAPEGEEVEDATMERASDGEEGSDDDDDGDEEGSDEEEGSEWETDDGEGGEDGEEDEEGDDDDDDDDDV